MLKFLDIINSGNTFNKYIIYYIYKNMLVYYFFTFLLIKIRDSKYTYKYEHIRIIL